MNSSTSSPPFVEHEAESAELEQPLEAVQAALDHSNLATTSIYLRQLEGQEDPWWPKLAAELGLEGGGDESFPPEERT